MDRRFRDENGARICWLDYALGSPAYRKPPPAQDFSGAYRTPDARTLQVPQVQSFPMSQNLSVDTGSPTGQTGIPFGVIPQAPPRASMAPGPEGQVAQFNLQYDEIGKQIAQSKKNLEQLAGGVNSAGSAVLRRTAENLLSVPNVAFPTGGAAAANNARTGAGA